MGHKDLFAFHYIYGNLQQFIGLQERYIELLCDGNLEEAEKVNGWVKLNCEYLDNYCKKHQLI